MLYTAEKNQKILSEKKLKIISDNKMMGILNISDNSVVLPIEYDNVFIYEKNILAVHKKGKIGAYAIESDNICCIADCVFDTISAFGLDLIFCNEEKIRYYNYDLKTATDFNEIIVQSPVLYCKDKNYQYILYGDPCEVIYKKKYTSYSESFFCYCGNTNKGPVFYDARYSSYLYPTDEGYKNYNDFLNHPVIINRENVVNITEGETGLGIIDSFGNAVINNLYDKIDIELQITATNDKEKITKAVPFSKKSFEKGKATEIENWL